MFIPRVKVVVIFGLLFILPLALYPIWLPWIGEYLVVSDPLQKADALVILAGNEDERIAAGAQIFRQGYASWFILTDMRLDLPDSQGTYSANVKQKAVAQGVPSGCILIVPGQVSTTGEEATQLAGFIISKGFHSIIVITSPYHTRRAGLILRQTFPENITLMITSSSSLNYHATTWWQNPSFRKETILEYAKILAHLLGCHHYTDCGMIPRDWLKSWLSDIPSK